MNLESRALEYIKKQNMLKSGDRIIAGVSGGADSVCMLTVLLELAPQLGVEIHAVHINHGIRGESAKRDENFVRSFCEARKVPFHCVYGDIPALVRETGETEEEAGRNFRYMTFQKLASELGCNRIAVAHNSDDNAETVLFNIFRGSGISGVRGIIPMREMKALPENHGNEGILLIRPLLPFTRKEIEVFLCERKLEWCTDETNLENGYSRNKIRNIILPMVKTELNANAAGHIGELSRQAAELEDFLDMCVEKELPKLDFSNKNEIGLEEEHLRGLHGALRRALVRKAFGMLSGRLKDVESTHISLIEALLDNGVGKRIDLPYNITAIRSYNGVTLRKKEYGEEKKTCSGACISMETVSREVLWGDYPSCADIQWFDADEIKEKLTVRHRQDGDYLLIGPEKHKKSLKRFMIDQKIPADIRDDIDLLADGSHILWVIGYRRDDSCYITGKTGRVVIAEKICTQD